MKFLKFILVFLGGAFIGFGAGLLTGKNLVFSDTGFWMAAIASLVLGGFLMALGITLGGRKKNTEKEEKGNNRPEPPQPAAPSPSRQD